MKNFAFDARYIKTDHPDGISRFSQELINELHATDPEFTVIISNEEQLSKLPTGIRWVKINRPDSIFERFAALRLNKYNFEVVFSPMQTIGSRGKKFKLILTLHDLIYYRHPTPPSELPWIIRMIWRLYHLSFWPQRVLLSKADELVTVSETTSKLIARHNLFSKPAAIIHNAVAIEPVAMQREPKLIYMGSFMPYKNVETLIRASALVPHLELHLLSGISDSRKLELSKLAVALGANCVFHNGVSDEDYLELLCSATALVSASLDEGFGIPLVEAMACGTPVVASEIDIFKEVAADAAVYFHPTSPDQLAEALMEVESNWERYHHRSKERAKEFSWAKSAAELRATVKNLNQ